MHLNTSLTLPESIPVNETVVSMSFPSEGAAENLHSATLARLSLWILNRVPATIRWEVDGNKVEDIEFPVSGPEHKIELFIKGGEGEEIITKYVTVIE